MKRKSMKRKSMKRKSMKPKQQKGGLIEDNKSNGDQRKLNGAKARLATELALTESEEIVSLPLELINMIGLHIKYEIHMIDESLPYHEQLGFLLPRLRVREDYIFFNNYINNLFIKFSSINKIPEHSAKIKLFSIYPDLKIFPGDGANFHRFLEIGQFMDEHNPGDKDVRSITSSLKKLNKEIVKNKLTILWPPDKDKLSLRDIFKLLKEYNYCDEEEEDKERYLKSGLRNDGLTLTRQKQDINSADYIMTDVVENESLLNHLVEIDTLSVGERLPSGHLNKFF
jgi:hypothetical protein